MYMYIQQNVNVLFTVLLNCKCFLLVSSSSYSVSSNVWDKVALATPGVCPTSGIILFSCAAGVSYLRLHISQLYHRCGLHFIQKILVCPRYAPPGGWGVTCGSSLYFLFTIIIVHVTCGLPPAFHCRPCA